MLNFNNLKTLPFEELSKDYSDAEINIKLRQTDTLTLMAHGLARFLPKLIVVGGVIVALFKALTGDLAAVAIILITVGILVVVIRTLFRHVNTRAAIDFRKMGLLQVRLRSFAESAGWVFRRSWKEPKLQGVPQRMTDRFWLQRAIMDDADKPSVIVGNSVLDIQTADGQLLFSSIVAIKLPHTVDQIYLESLTNKEWRLKNLSGEEYKDLVQLELEGDFQKYFKLYCQPNQEREALYIFSPELMELMITTSQQFSAELIGSWLFLFREESFTYSETEMRDIFRIISLVGEEFRDNTSNLGNNV